MKKASTVIIAYFPVILVGLQVLANMLYFFDREFYIRNGFYLNLTVGTNLLFPLFMLAITLKFRFCSVSRWAAIAECLFALYYLIVQKDDVYNILFQITIGLIAIGITFYSFVRKFPICRISLWVRFWHYVIKKRSCIDGLHHWDAQVRKEIIKTQKLNHER